MGEKSVIVVISEYNDLSTNASIINVYHDMDAFEDDMRNYLNNYAEEHYNGEEGLTECCDKTLDEYINVIISDLKRNDMAVDPMDDLQVWRMTERTIKHLNYVQKIREILSKNKYPLNIEDIRFFPSCLDGSDDIIQAIDLCVNADNEVVFEDTNGDFWLLSAQPIHKQEELCHKLKAK